MGSCVSLSVGKADFEWLPNDLMKVVGLWSPVGLRVR